MPLSTKPTQHCKPLTLGVGGGLPCFITIGLAVRHFISFDIVIMATVLDIKLKRATKVYKEGEVVAGTVVIESKGECSHQGVTLTADGSVSLQLSSKSVGVFEAFYNSVKPIQLLSQVLEIAKPGKFPSGKTEIPFEIPLKAKGNKKLYESYHGVYISIQYSLVADMKRGMLSKDLRKDLEFLVDFNHGDKLKPQPLDFTLTPENLQNAKSKSNIPKFKINGKIDSLLCNITDPFTGQITIESCSNPIKSMELQLLRVETCGCAEGYAKDATEIQNIQIAEGDVAHHIAIPLYMVFPRLFTAPTLTTNNFKIEFEINLVVVFKGDMVLTENFPIKVTRV
ncbi:DSCR3 [Bugula neritina]|uniref:Vacuolar protein sorting-associated protein 26C n=1 Tax=Bugula neritina TaxID=10212 RepID=A0A7J7K8U7_BUGNE|nr:DSCR3 [Bugula neritina]